MPIFSWLVLTLFSAMTSGQNLSQTQLSSLDNSVAPWLSLEAEQPRLYVGLSPRELVLSMSPKAKADLNPSLRDLGKKALQSLLRELKLKSAEFEMWPQYDDWGAHTWVIARYRETETHQWIWLNETHHQPLSNGGPADRPRAILPRHLNPNVAQDAALIFDQTPKDLYQQPLFSTVLWMNHDLTQVTHPWLSPSRMEGFKPPANTRAIALPAPSRFNGSAKTFVTKASQQEINWPNEIQFTKHLDRPFQPENKPSRAVYFRKEFSKKYRDDVSRFSGALPVHDPDHGKLIDFEKLSSGDPQNHLLALVRYLKERYEAIGFGKTPNSTIEIQSYEWRTIPQANLVLKIKGSNPSALNRPIILSDHIDKAISEDIFEATAERITTPGADDNATATSTLLRASEIFKARYQLKPPPHDIWIVHFTGEEFPANCAGARHFVSQLLRSKQDIGANINIDMIGHHTPHDKIFQLNPGFSLRSKEIALEALRVAKALGNQWVPMIRSSESKTSYYTQTDSMIFDIAGYPTLLINEHINLTRRLNPHYHQSTDLPRFIDFDYAEFQAKVAITTAIRLAESN